MRYAFKNVLIPISAVSVSGKDNLSESGVDAWKDQRTLIQMVLDCSISVLLYCLLPISRILQQQPSNLWLSNVLAEKNNSAVNKWYAVLLP